MGGGAGMGAGASAGAGAATAAAPAAAGAAGAGGGWMGLMKQLGPILFQQGSKENEAVMNSLARTGPPPTIQPLGAGGGPAGVGGNLGTSYKDAMRPPSRLPAMPRGAAATQPNFGGVGGALSGVY